MSEISCKERMRAAIESARAWHADHPEVTFYITPSMEEDWTEDYAYAQYELHGDHDYFDYDEAQSDMVAALHSAFGGDFMVIWGYDPKRVLVAGMHYLHMRGGEIEAYRHRARKTP